MSRATLCETCHDVFEDDYRDHAVDEHREQFIRGEDMWFRDVEGTAFLLLAPLVES